MIVYTDGTEAMAGDRVDIDRRPGIVECVVDTETQQSFWGLDQRGLMVRTALALQVQDQTGRWIELADPDTLVFEAVDSPGWGSIHFLGRGQTDS